MSTTVPESDVGALEVPVKGSFRGLHDVSLVARQVGFEQLSFWLNPIGALMTIAFSVVFLILLGATAGTTTVSSYGHIKLIDYYVAGFCAYGVMAACFTILAIQLVNRREMGLLKRLRLSPLPTWMAMTAVLVNAMIVAALGVILLLVIGRLGYGVHGPAHWLPFIVTLVVGMLCYSALGCGRQHPRPQCRRGGSDGEPHLLHSGGAVRSLVPHRPGFGPGHLRRLLSHPPSDRRVGRLLYGPGGHAPVALARPRCDGHLGRRGCHRRVASLELVAQARLKRASVPAAVQRDGVSVQRIAAASPGWRCPPAPPGVGAAAVR